MVQPEPVKVDPEKWEAISYGQIKKNDLIRCVTVQGNVINDTQGVVDWYDVIGVRDNMGINFLSDPSRFKPLGTGYRTIYRRKPEPFVFPTTPLSIIEGTPCTSSGGTRRYIRTEAGSWRSTDSGGLAFEEALRSNFKDWKVIYEGIEL